MVSAARIGMALVVSLDPGEDEETQPGTIVDARIGIGALGETAFRAGRLEELLVGRPADAETRSTFVEACPEMARDAIPGRSSLPYKQEAIRGVATDAWDALGLGPAAVSVG
jgi:carbon-monoxide dehydrogenase medium subunit